MPDLNTAYSWAINTCDAPNVGYSQTYRNQQQVNGVTYYDCSPADIDPVPIGKPIYNTQMYVVDKYLGGKK